MITIKNASQIAKMREAGALLHEVLEQLKGKIEPGITTKELDRYAEKLIRGYGAVPSFLNYEGYPASICASVDSQVVHGIPNESTVLREGQIISIDSGLILDGWQSDSAFTVGVGTVSPEAQRLIDVTEQSFFAALQVAREGYRVSDIGHAVQQYVEERGFAAGRDLCGHGIGRELHEVLEQLKGKIEPGITTKELDRYAEKLIRGYGAVPSFLNYEGYPASICASVDSQVVHGIPDESTVLREGQIISIDSGLILDGWQSDSAFTVGVGTVSPQAQRLIDVTEQSFFAALQVAREGYRVSDIGHAVQQYVEERGFSAVRDLCGHGIGREMHEDPSVPNFGAPGHGVRLRRGMTICIEPMITAGSYNVKTLRDGWTVVTTDGSLCSHYEHTILITDGEPELLSLPGYHKEEKR